jgi:uncharacterized membrane protein YphA (DoxX/SURF4 family)/protein-disulfide isomerase
MNPWRPAWQSPASTLGRLFLAGVFLFAGWPKFLDGTGTVRSVQSYTILPENVVTPFAYTLPVVELLVAVYLLIGLRTRRAAIAGAGLLAIFMLGIGWAWARGLSIDCGCFGRAGSRPSDPVSGYVRDLLRDGVLLIVAGFVAARPYSRLSIDYRRELDLADQGPLHRQSPGGEGPGRTDPRRNRTGRSSSRGRRRVPTWVTAAVPLVLIVGIVAVRTGQGQRTDTRTLASLGPATLIRTGTSPVAGFPVGRSDAAVTIDIFEDFLCPACRNFEESNAEQLTSWTKAGTVKVVFHPIALLDKHSTNKYSTRALNACVAVIDAIPTAFPKLHDLLFANQPAEGTPGLTDDQLIDLADQAGVSGPRVEAAIRGLRYGDWTIAQTDAFFTLPFHSTPTVLVNGKAVKDLSDAALGDAVRAASR